MVWTMSANLRRELEAGDSAPVLAVRLRLPILRRLEVRDYTQGAGDTISIQVNGDASTLNVITEGAGQNFLATGSNAATARNIANGWNASAARVAVTQTRAVHRTGNFVSFVGLNYTVATMTITSSDSGAWADASMSNPTTFDLCSWTGRLSSALSGYWPVVSDLKGLEWSMNPITRVVQPPRADLTFVPGDEIRELLEDYTLLRAPVDLYVGTDGLTAFGDFMALPRLFVEDVVPKGGSVVLKLVDAAGDAWRDVEVTGRWTNWHPLQVVHDVLLKAGAIAGTHFDVTSIAYDTADTARSHFVLSRFQDELFGMRNPIDEGQRAGELVDQLLALMSGTWRPTQAGPYTFRRYRSTDGVVRSWAAGPETGHDIDEIEEGGIYEDLINEYVVSFARGDQGKIREYRETDQVSVVEGNNLKIDAQHRTNWLNGVAELGAEVYIGGVLSSSRFLHGGAHSPDIERIYNDTIEFPVDWASRQGFSGTQREAGSPSAQAPGMSLGSAAGRYVVLAVRANQTIQRDPSTPNEIEYLLIDEWEVLDDSRDDENVQACPQGAPIVSAQRVVMSRYAFRARITNDAASTVLAFNGRTIGDFFGAGAHPSYRTGRGILGGTDVPQSWGGRISALIGDPPVLEPVFYQLLIEDHTIPVYMAKEIVARTRFGMPKLSHYTSLLHADLELGEFVNFQNDDVSASRLRGFGADTNVIYEVTKKRIEIFGDNPGIEWEVTYVRDDALLPIPIATAITPPPTVTIANQQISTQGSADLTLIADDGETIVADDDEVMIEG